MNANHGFLLRLGQIYGLVVLGIDSDIRLRGQGDTGAGLHQPIHNLLIQPIDGILLIGNHIHIGVAQQLPVYRHTALQYNGVNIGLVERHLGRCPRRLSVGVDLEITAGDFPTHGGTDGSEHLFQFLRLADKGCTAAEGTGILVNGGRLRHFMGQHEGRVHSVLQKFHRCRHGLFRRLTLLPSGRTHLAAAGAYGLPPRLVILQILQLHRIDPAVPIDAAVGIALEAHILGHCIVAVIFAAGAADFGVAFAFLRHILAVPGFHRGFGGGNLHNEPIHVLHIGVNTGLRHQLLRVQHGQHKFACMVKEPLPAVPIAQIAHATLNQGGAVSHVIDGLNGQAVQLVAKKMLDDVCQHLVLLPPGRDLRLRDDGADLTFNVFEGDVAHMAGFQQFPVFAGVTGDKGCQRVVTGIHRLPVIHFFHFRRKGDLTFRQPLTPFFQLFVFLFHVSTSKMRYEIWNLIVGAIHESPAREFHGFPHMRSIMARSSGLAFQ